MSSVAASIENQRTHMRAIIVGVLSIWIASCAVDRASDNSYESALARYNQAKDSPGFAAYGHAFIEAQNYQQLDDKSGCYSHDIGKRVVLILFVNAEGRITAAYTDNESTKAKCFRRAYIGAQMPAPPFDPFPIRLRMN
jgi:hypothetical protein